MVSPALSDVCMPHGKMILGEVEMFLSSSVVLFLMCTCTLCHQKITWNAAHSVFDLLQSSEQATVRIAFGKEWDVSLLASVIKPRSVRGSYQSTVRLLSDHSLDP